MSLSKRLSLAPAFVGRGAVAVLLVVLLAACGYAPLYGPRENSTTAAELATVKIALIGNRSGQVLRNFLLDRINPKGQPANPRFELFVNVNEIRRNLAIRRDETATRANLIVNATYSLVRQGVEKPVLAAEARSINSFNIVDSDFSTLAAEGDARRRALRELSDQIALRLAIYFNGRTDGS